MATSEELNEWDRHYLWHAFTQMAEHEPLIVERGEGCFLWDTDGKRYLDGVSSLWCNLHGHNHPQLNAAISGQLAKLAHATTLGMSNPPAIELARRLAQITPGDLEHVFYSCDGSSAVEVALKVCFQYWQQCDAPKPKKKKYLAFGNAYHGDTLGSTAVGGIQHFHEIFGPLLCEVVRVPSPDRRFGTTEEHLGKLGAVLAEQHETIAALVIEPLVQGAAGLLMQGEGYLRGVRELCTRYEVLMIADEIVTGFGRTGKLFACEHENVVPDLMCLGKSLTAGYLPMAATMVTSKVYEAFLGEYHEQRTFYHGHTFGGNPLAAAVALASIDLVEASKMLSEVLPPRIEQFCLRLQRLEQHPEIGRHLGDVRQLGLMAGVDLVADRENNIPYEAHQRVGYQVCKATTEAGVWLRPLGDVVVLIPPPVISEEELDLLFDALTQSLLKICVEIAVQPQA
ncbi:adenosylmethionine--8-amino-7-oxononanoate transaminase [Adhaeretor mobilis]|uniref:Adenosylmethionine-8-amino-7-oxononanoate aminotransferase n=1 Tax=Adhaeretor mobilis TaxID=1930276 RepID=A0A517MXS9_9BACT|nr:adenosylmethionine--8-amino-7-oxononanoate transaminase [Adhaeretor mobilis]QDS99673.1 L-Lysine-8-amino-7-oxononanoate aminotransferase [Adhaeretor mobilis]